MQERPSQGAERRSRLTMHRDDRGASSVELLFYAPILMLVIFLTVQFALTWHGNSVAGAVARETARAARTSDGGPAALDAARQRGLDLAAEVGRQTLTDVDIAVALVDADGGAPAAGEDELYVSVTVSGRAIELIGGLPPRVEGTAQAPLETFRGDL